MAFQLDNMEQLMRQIQQMGRTIDETVTEKALKEGAKIMQTKIKANAPQRTGKLKENIVISDVNNGQIAIGPDQQGPAFYGHFLEFGTSKMNPQPFMGPAFENGKHEVQQKMGDVIKRELNL